jgi:molybdopterin-guanine dinucleotide biosynthesis protein A
MSVAGAILAGGKSARMAGTDKSLALLEGKTLIAHVAERLAPQVAGMVISANGDPARFDFLRLPVIADADESQSGPLAGILAGMEWARTSLPSAEWVMSVATDTPFIPHDLVRRLLAASGDPSTVRVAQSAGRLHQVIALWPVASAGELAVWLRAGKARAVHAWLGTRQMVAVPFELAGGIDPFFNINTPDDLAKAEVPFLESGR